MSYINNTTLLSGLVRYRDELSAKEILIESVFSARTAQLVKIETGVKGTMAIPYITSNPIYTIAQCGLLAGTGSVTLAQQDITVSDLAQNEDLCLVGSNTLSKYFTGMAMSKGINQTELTPKIFATAFVADKTLKLSNFIEQLVWEGNMSGSGTFSTDQGMTLANGFLYQLNSGGGSSSVILGTYSAGPLTVSQTVYPNAGSGAINVINSLINQVPQAIADKDLILFLSLPNFRAAVNDLIYSNNYHYTGVDHTDASSGWKITWPFASNVTLVATSGLKGRNDLVLTDPNNFYIGMDGESDYDQFNIWYSDDLNAVRFRAQFRVGTAVLYPQYVVYQKG